MNPWTTAARFDGDDGIEMVFDEGHLDSVVRPMLRARVSLDIATADFKAMLVPDSAAGSGAAPSIVTHLSRLADRGVEVRVLHAGVPSSAALAELRRGLPPRLQIRRCPRLHAKMVCVDAASIYLGSANLTGAGLGAKGSGRRNFEWGIRTARVEMIDAIMQRFNSLWEGRDCPGCGRREVCPVPLEEPNLGRAPA